jgi:hypothetical protein
MVTRLEETPADVIEMDAVAGMAGGAEATWTTAKTEATRISGKQRFVFMAT